MAANLDPVYAGSINVGTAVTTSVADTEDSTPSGLQLLLTAGSNGTELNYVGVQPRATNTETLAILYLELEGSETMEVYASQIIEAETTSTTAGHTTTPIAGIVDAVTLRKLPANAKLHCGSTVALAAGFGWVAEGVDF